MTHTKQPPRFPGRFNTPDGHPWEGWRGLKYRLKPSGVQKGRYVDMATLDSAVIQQVLSDLRAPDLVRDLTQAARRAADALQGDPAAEARMEVLAITAQISRAMDLALQLTDPAPALRKISELEARRNALQAEIAQLEQEYVQQALLKTLTEERVAAVLEALAGMI